MSGKELGGYNTANRTATRIGSVPSPQPLVEIGLSDVVLNHVLPILRGRLA